MSETITEENITAPDHTSVAENTSTQEITPGQNIPSANNHTIDQENASAVENTASRKDAPAAESTAIQEDAPAAESAAIQEDTEDAPAAKNTTDQAQTTVVKDVVTDNTDPFDKAEKERDSSGFFARFSSKIASIRSRREAKLVRDEIILSRIPDKDLMEYLRLEQRRMESQQHAREIREKRIWIAFQMTVALIAAVLVIYFLKDSPAILISILYTAGLLIAFNIWNKHKDGRSPKDQ